MADLLWPLGSPEDDTLDGMLGRQQADIRRSRTPFEPPAAMGLLPDLVPKAFFRKAQQDDFQTRGAGVAFRNDARDTAFNFDVQAAAEIVSGVDHQQIIGEEEALAEPTMTDLVRVEERDVIAQIRRMQDDGATFSSPSVYPPDQGPVGPYGMIRPQTGPVGPYGPAGLRSTEDAEQRGTLDYLSDIASGTRRTLRGFGLLTGPEAVIGNGQDIGSGLVEIATGTMDLSLHLAGRTVEVSPFALPLTAVERAAQAWGARDPWGLVRAEPGEAVAGLQRVASAMGKSFDGTAFWRGVWVNGGAMTASALTPFGSTSYEQYRQQAERNWDEYYADLPRPAQVFVEEASIGNIALALAGGPLSRVLLASGTRGATMLGRFVAPMAANPLVAVSAEVGASAGTRIGWEATPEDAPLPIRVAAAITLGALTGMAPVAVAGVARQVGRDITRTLDNVAIDRLQGELDRIPPVADGMTRLYRAEPAGGGLRVPEAAEVFENNGDAVGRWFTDSVDSLSFYVNDIGARRVRVRMMDIPTDEAARFRVSGIDDVRPFSGNPDREFFLPRESAAGSLVLDDIVKITDPEELAIVLRNAPDDEVARVVAQAEAMTVDERIAARRAEMAAARASATPARSTAGGWPTRAERAAIAEADVFRLNSELDVIRDNISRFSEVSDRGFVKIGDRDFDLAELLAQERALATRASRSADELAELTKPLDPPPMLGLTRSSDPSLPVQAAMGDGGLLKMGEPDEMISDTGRYVRDSWRGVDQPEGEVISGRFVPFLGNPRTRRVPGGKLTPIPDVITLQRDPGVFNVVDQRTLSSGQSRAGQVQTAAERAADWAAQQNVSVPPGAMQAVNLAQTDQLMRQGMLTPVIDFFNHATDNLIVRTGIIAKRYSETEFLSRIMPSRRQFFGRIREIYGDTTLLPENIEYVGPATRPWGQRAAVPAIEHPLTGTIVDQIENPGFYDTPPPPEAVEAFLRYTNRGSAVNNTMKSDYGVSVGTFDSGLYGDAEQVGIFIPTRDAGLGRIARGTDNLPLGAAPGSTFHEKQFATITSRMADPVAGEGFVPITDLYQLFTRLDLEKAREVGRETLRFAVGGSAERVPGWQQVASLGSEQWLPTMDAQDLARYLDSENVAFAEALSNLKNSTLGADFSPLTIQGSIGWAIAPVEASRDMINSFVTGLRNGDPMMPFRSDRMYQDMAAAPQRWMRFLTAMGQAPDGGVPREWRSTFIEKLPARIGDAVAAGNDWLYNVLMRGQESTFDSAYTTLLSRGFDDVTAVAGAADVTKMAWLMSGAENIGETAMRQSVERGGFISATFIRQPVNMVAHAASGYAQIIAAAVTHPAEIGTKRMWQRVGPREQLAAQMFTKLQGTMAGLSTASALYFANERGYTPAEAAQNALNPNHSDFGRLWLTKDVSIPLGGPYRALFQAMAPQPLVVAGNTVIDAPVPFGGVPQFLQNRITTAVTTGMEVVADEDFFGNPIRTKDGIMGLLQTIGYIAVNTVPVSLATPIESTARGDSAGGAVGKTVWQFFGQNPLAASEFAVMERERRLAAREIYDLPPDRKIAIGMTSAQVLASGKAQTLAQLREAIGTRSANYVAQMQRAGVGEARERYVADLRRKRDAGSRDAEAVLVSIELQDSLGALATKVTGADGVPDRKAYKEQRTHLIDQALGQSKAFQAVFEGFRQSDNQIDRLTAERYDLRDKASIRQKAPSGQDAVLGMDWDMLEQLEREFDSRIGPDMAALVDANMSFASLHATPLEVERHGVVNDLSLSGLWEIDDTVYAAGQAQMAQAFAAAEKAGRVPAGDEAVIRDAFASSKSITEFVSTMTPYVTAQYKRTAPNLTDAEAQRLAKDAVGKLASPIYDATSQQKRLWVSEHIADGLAQRAFEWDYITSAQYRDGGGFNRLQQQATPAAPAAKSGATSARPAESEEDVNARLIAGFAAGRSYGQLAIETGLSRDAVIGRIKRASEGRPANLRE